MDGQTTPLLSRQIDRRTDRRTGEQTTPLLDILGRIKKEMKKGIETRMKESHR